MSTLRKGLVFLLSLSFVLLFVVAFAQEKPEYLVENYTGKYGGTLYVGTLSGPKTLNPCTAYETSSTDIIGWFLDYLVDFNKDGSIRGGALAKDWTISDDGKSYIFKIRKGLKWSDGTPFTGEDVYFSFATIWTSKELAGNLYDGLLGPD
ncbi:MAG TPA: ABC transporter substrate-binding protein, partial [Thermotogaceae bacterium]|nr:ABC transporter substrate-binding protein [Thermotogaceae bacterium]